MPVICLYKFKHVTFVKGVGNHEVAFFKQVFSEAFDLVDFKFGQIVPAVENQAPVSYFLSADALLFRRPYFVSHDWRQVMGVLYEIKGVCVVSQT